MKSNIDICEPFPIASVKRRIKTSWKPQSSSSSQIFYYIDKWNFKNNTVMTVLGFRRPRNDTKKQTVAILSYKEKN